MPVPCCFYYYSSVVALEIRDGDTSGSTPFIVENCFSYSGVLFACLFIHVELTIVLSRSVHTCIGILMGLVLNV